MCLKFYKCWDIVSLKDTFISNFKSIDLFSDNIIIVPNINVKKWLQLELAKKKNVIASLNILYLESGLFYILKKIFDIDKKYIFLNNKDRLIDLQLLIILILQEFSEQNELDIFKKYYIKENGYDFNALWNLSEKLSYYIREYQYQKIDIISKWENNEFYFKDINKKDIEKAYKFIYRKLFCEENNYLKKINEKDNKFIYTTLYDFVNKYFSDQIDQKIKEKFNKDFKIYVFGLSLISHFHIEIILKLSKYFDIEFYQLNYLDLSDNESNYLNMYLKASIKNNCLINKILENKNYNIKYEIINKDIPQNSVLNLLKYFILTNKNVDKKQQDESIQIIGCPTIYREVETVYNSIIYNLLNNKELKLTDIAIFVTDMDKYRFYIENIFNQYKIILYNLNDFTISNESNFYKAIYSFFELVNSNFRKDKLLDLIVNPLIMNKFILESYDIENIIKLLSELNIFHSYNIKDKKKVSFFDTPYFTWEYGLLRLKLSLLFFKSSDQNNRSIFNITNNYINNYENLEKIVKIFDNIFYFFNSLNNNNSFIDWKNSILYFIENFLKLNDEDKIDNILKDKTLFLLENLDKFENILSLRENNNSESNLNFIKNYILSNIQKIEAQKRSYLSDGIVISKLQPMKPIPFKIVYILGLNEDIFPSIIDLSTIDIRNLDKNDIEYITKNESDKYLFLETLFSVQEKLYLLYNNKDLEKDKDLFPSSVINDIIFLLEDKIINNKFEIFKTRLFTYDSNNLLKDKDEYQSHLPEKQQIIEYFNKNKDTPIEIINYSILQNNNDNNRIVKININDIADFFIEPKKIFLKNKINIDISYYNKNINNIIEPFYETKYNISNYVNKYLIDLLQNRNISEKEINDHIKDYIKNEIENCRMPEPFYSEYTIKKIYNKIIQNKDDFQDICNKNNLKDCREEKIGEFEYIYNEKYLIKGNIEKLLLKDNNYYDILITEDSNFKKSYYFKIVLRKIFNLLLLKEKNNLNNYILIIIIKLKNLKLFNLDLDFDININKIIEYYIRYIYKEQIIFNLDFDKVLKKDNYTYNDYLNDIEQMGMDEDNNWNNSFKIKDEEILIKDKNFNFLSEQQFNEYYNIMEKIIKKIYYENRNL